MFAAVVEFLAFVAESFADVVVESVGEQFDILRSHLAHKVFCRLVFGIPGT